MAGHVGVRNLPAGITAFHIFDLFRKYGWIQRISSLAAQGTARACTVTFTTDASAAQACTEHGNSFKEHSISVRRTEVAAPGISFSGSRDLDYVTIHPASSSVTIAIVSSVPSATPPHAVYDHFHQAGAEPVVGVAFVFNAPDAVIYVLVFFCAEQHLEHAVRALNGSLLGGHRIFVRKYLAAREGQSAGGTVKFQKAAIAPRATHTGEIWYDMFVNVFAPMLRSMLPVNDAEANAILAQMYENLPYAMRPPRGAPGPNTAEIPRSCCIKVLPVSLKRRTPPSVRSSPVARRTN
jgi:hypothetical protein